jgi:hypothetical protein
MMTFTDGYTITDVPGVIEIKIQPDPGSEHGVRILISDNRNELPQSWGLEELGEYRQAIGQALELGYRLVAEIQKNNPDVPDDDA